MSLPYQYNPYQTYYDSFYPTIQETVMPLEQYYSVPNLPKIRKLKKKHTRPKIRTRPSESLSSSSNKSSENGNSNGNGNGNYINNGNGNANNAIISKEELWQKREEILKEKFLAHSGTDLM